MDSPDIALADSTTTTSEAVGAETSVFVHPSNYRIVLVSEILKTATSDTTGGCAGWVSQDAGAHWHGDNAPAHSGGNGDPTAVIQRSSSGSLRYFVSSLSAPFSVIPHDADLEEGQRVAYKDSPTSLTWAGQTIIVPGLTDKGYLWPDNNTSSSDAFRGSVYAAWSEDTRVRFARSNSDNGESWHNIQTIGNDGSHANWGVNLKVSIASDTTLGHVYAVWARSNTGDFAGKKTGIYYRKSRTGGQQWVGSNETLVSSLNGGGFAGRETLPGGFTMGANSAPSMAVDDSSHLYVAWGQKNTGAGNADVYLVKSVDEGATWTALGSNPKKVSQDAGTADQWLPWIAWDNGTRALVVVYYDSRESSHVNLYASVSYNGGSTFEDVKVSDAYWSGNASFAGDYVGVDARDGVAYPAWVDDRETTGTFKVYVSPIQLWSVVQSSVSQSLVNDEGLQLTVTGAWNTDSWSDGTDSLVVTSPTAVKYTGTHTLSGTATSHSVAKLCTCEAGDWTYVVKSCRPGFKSRVSTSKTFRIYNCVD